MADDITTNRAYQIGSLLYGPDADFGVMGREELLMDIAAFTVILRALIAAGGYGADLRHRLAEWIEKPAKVEG